MVRATVSIYGFNPQRHTVIKGNLFLVQEEGFIKITGKLRGLNFNSTNHSLNIHETGSVSVGSKCKDTGPPFNPDFMATTKASLLGNIRTNSRGEALVDLRIPAERVCLIAWTKYNILNRSLVTPIASSSSCASRVVVRHVRHAPVFGRFRRTTVLA